MKNNVEKRNITNSQGSINKIKNSRINSQNRKLIFEIKKIIHEAEFLLGWVPGHSIIKENDMNTQHTYGNQNK